jgi:hypothetical protein
MEAISVQSRNGKDLTMSFSTRTKIAAAAGLLGMATLGGTAAIVNATISNGMPVEAVQAAAPNEIPHGAVSNGMPSEAVLAVAPNEIPHEALPNGMPSEIVLAVAPNEIPHEAVPNGMPSEIVLA